MPPDPAVIAWLWSEEGIAWHKVEFSNVRHGGGHFAEVKRDNECGCVRGGKNCYISTGPYNCDYIHADIARYGISGVPPEWKRRFGCL